MIVLIGYFIQLGEICGLVALALPEDFNFVQEYCTAEKFLKYFEDNFFSQVFSEPARKVVLLDSLFVNREDL